MRQNWIMKAIKKFKFIKFELFLPLFNDFVAMVLSIKSKYELTFAKTFAQSCSEIFLWTLVDIPMRIVLPLISTVNALPNVEKLIHQLCLGGKKAKKINPEYFLSCDKNHAALLFPYPHLQNIKRNNYAWIIKTTVALVCSWPVDRVDGTGFIAAG